MTIAFRSSTTAGHVAPSRVSSLTINKPAGVVDNDTLIAAIYTGGLVFGISPPTGWVFRGRVADTFGKQLCVYVKVASSEPSNWTWTFNSPYGTSVIEGFVAAYSGGAGLATLLGTYVRPGFSNTRSVTSPGGFSSAINSQIVRIGAFLGIAPGANVVATLGGYTREIMRYDANSSVGALLTLEDVLAAAPVAVPGASFVLNSPVQSGMAITLALPSGDSVPVAQNVAPYDQYNYYLAGTPTFAWSVSDDDLGDYQSAYALRRKVGAGAYQWWNAGTVSWQGTEVYNTRQHTWVTFPAASWTTGTTYLWSVAVKDSQGTPSSYSTDTTVTATAAIPTLVATDPEATSVGGPRPVLAAKFTPTGGAPPVTYYFKVFDAVVVSDPDFNPDVSVPLWDSGTNDPNLGGFITSGTDYLFAAVPTVDIPNNGSYYVYVLAFDNAQRASGWVGKAFVTLFAVPAAPTAAGAAVVGSSGPRIDLTCTTLANLLTLNQSTISSSIVGWKALASCTVARSSVQALNGQYSLALTATASATMTACTNEGKAGIPVTVGVSYEALASLRGSNFAASRTCRVGIRWYDSAGALLSTSFGGTGSVGNGAWVGLTVTATAPANAVWAAVVVEVQSAVNAEIGFADSIFLGAPSAAFTPGGRVFGNILDFDTAGFENAFNNNSDWVADDNCYCIVTSSFFHSGAQSLQVFVGRGGNVIIPPIGPIASIMAPTALITVGRLYTASIWIRSAQIRDYHISADWVDILGNVISSSDGATVTLAVTTWTQVYVSATAPAGAVGVRLRVVLENAVLADGFLIDDATLTQGFTLLTDDSPCMPLYVEIQYSDDAGVTWADVRGAMFGLVDIGDLQSTISDFETPITKTRTYRMRNVSMDGSIFTAWSTSVAVVQSGSGDWWLKDLFDSTLNATFFVEAAEGGGFDADGQVTQSRLDVLGRPDYVVITDTWKSDLLSFKSLMFAADFAAFEKLRKNNRPLLIQSDSGLQWYIALDKRTRHLKNTNQEFQEVDLSATEVMRPPV